ncbi:sulfite exporter TauE/SafE family protein [Candidatus Pacearchaeota archaeon]|nr:sulfite exporter TauE/SafE family protein [Candidatus Pacearchaeota archaeon]
MKTFQTILFLALLIVSSLGLYTYFNTNSLSMPINSFLIIILIAFICEWIDSGLGMGYGTILSPLLIFTGFPTLIVVPSILITQAIGGLSASICHHKYRNANFSIKSKNPIYIAKKIKQHGPVNAFKKGVSEDLKTVAIITSLGIIATIIATFVAINISKTALNTYIGIIVVLMGLIILLGFTFVYSTVKMFIVGIVSAFNKGLSGGGFGPVVTGGQMVLGKDHKKAIGCTTASEPLICITGFIAYFFLKGISNWGLIYALGIGALVGGVTGPWMTKRINKKTLKIIIGLLMLFLGILTLLKTYNLIGLKISM